MTEERGPAADIEWTRANLREVLPDLPSPQVMDFLIDTLNRAERHYAGALWAPESELGPIVRIFYGRPYFNVSQLRYLAALAGTPPARIFRALGHSGTTSSEDERRAPRPWKGMLRALPNLMRIMWYQVRLRHFVNVNLAKMRRRQARFAALPVASLADAELSAIAREWVVTSPPELIPIFVLTGVMGFEDALRRILDGVGVKYDAFVHPWLAAGEKSVSAQQGFDLLRLARGARAEPATAEYFRGGGALPGYRDRLAGTRFLASFDRFLDEYGHRGPYESDWALPRFRDDPSPILAAIQAHVRAPDEPDPDAIVAAQERRARDAWEKFDARLTTWQRLTVRRRVRWLVQRIKQMYVWRELYRSELTRVLAAGRRIYLELASRFAARGWIDAADDFYLLTLGEVAAAIGRRSGEGPRDIVAARRRDMTEWAALDMPLMLRESELGAIRGRAPAPPIRAQTELRGLCVSNGVAEGPVVVLRTPDEFGRMQRGAIIVAPATDPAWTPLFTLASGLIVEIGGTLSHASTVAREYGLPALANVTDATRLLRDGDRVRLDATAGTVTILASTSTAAAAE